MGKAGNIQAAYLSFTSLLGLGDPVSLGWKIDSTFLVLLARIWGKPKVLFIASLFLHPGKVVSVSVIFSKIYDSSTYTRTSDLL